MITLNHIISDIRNLATSGSNPIEFRISDEQITFWVNEVRAMLIAQSINKRDDLNDSWLQTISCVELEQINASECCGIESDCYILRSVKKIPSTIDTYKDNWIVSVTTSLGDIIPKINRFKARYIKANQFTSKHWGWYLKDNYLYVINEQLLTYVNITGIFTDPSELEDFVGCDNNTCFSIDEEYPVSLNMAKQITDIIMQTRVYQYLNFNQDKSNDGADESLTLNKPPKQ